MERPPIKKFGYPTVKKNTQLNNKYIIKDKLKKGRFSRVFSASAADGEQYAIKIYRNGSKFKEYFDNEIKIFNTLKAVNCPNLIKMLDKFVYLNFCHTAQKSFLYPCVVFPLYGENLSQLLNRLDDGLNIKTTAAITKQILLGLSALHKNKIIHTDLSMYNVLIASMEPPDRVNVVIGDLGSSTLENGKYFKRFIGTIETNSPEALLELKYTRATDIWSLGCIIFELITGQPLFTPTNFMSSDESAPEFGDVADLLWSEEEGAAALDYSSGEESDPTWLIEHEHLRQMEELLGPFPKELYKLAPQFFTHKGQLISGSTGRRRSIKKRLGEYKLDANEIKIVGPFIGKCIKYLPNNRATADELLNGAGQFI